MLFRMIAIAIAVMALSSCTLPPRYVPYAEPGKSTADLKVVPDFPSHVDIKRTNVCVDTKGDLWTQTELAIQLRTDIATVLQRKGYNANLCQELPLVRLTIVTSGQTTIAEATQLFESKYGQVFSLGKFAEDRDGGRNPLSWSVFGLPGYAVRQSVKASTITPDSLYVAVVDLDVTDSNSKLWQHRMIATVSQGHDDWRDQLWGMIERRIAELF